MPEKKRVKVEGEVSVSEATTSKKGKDKADKPKPRPLTKTGPEKKKTPPRSRKKVFIAAVLVGLMLLVGLGMLIWGLLSLGGGSNGDEQTSVSSITATPTSTPVLEATTSVPSEEKQQGMLFGIIRARDGREVSGATVRLIYPDASVHSLLTDDKGFYSIELPNGRYVIAVEHAGYEVSLLEQAVNGRTRQDIELVPYGQAAPPQGVNNPANYVLQKGAQTEVEVNIILAAYGMQTEGINVVPVTLSGDRFIVVYRDGQTTAKTEMPLYGEPAWKVTFPDGTVVYVQKKCGNPIEVPFSPPTPSPTPQATSAPPPTPTSTPTPSSTPPPSPTPIPSPTPTSIPTLTSTPTSTPTSTSTPTPPKSVIFEPLTPSGPAPLSTAFRIIIEGGVVNSYQINCGGGVLQGERCLYSSPGTYHPGITVYFEDGDIISGNSQVVVY